MADAAVFDFYSVLQHVCAAEEYIGIVSELE